MKTNINRRERLEEVISMFLGLVIVVVIVGLIFSYFQRKRGSVDIPGLVTNLDATIEPKVEPSNNNLADSMPEDTYTVKSGDSLWKISTSYYGIGDSWIEISKVNKLADPNMIEVGQKLILPGRQNNQSVTADKQNQNQNYSVNEGDYLWKIAVNKYGDGFAWVKIWQANRQLLVNPDRLEVGMSLLIP